MQYLTFVAFYCFSAGVFEEEDFQPALYGYSVCSEVTEVRAGGMMREVEEELQRAVKASRNRQGEPWDTKMQKQVRGHNLILKWEYLHSIFNCIIVWDAHFPVCHNYQ